MRPLLLALALLAAPASALDRDWARHPALVEIDNSEDIYVVGDPHGDYTRLVKTLRGAGVIANSPKKPESAEWSAGTAVLVVMGDLINKGADSLDVIRLLRVLAASAQEKGGQVVVLTGNHEAEFLADPDSDKARDFATELKKAGYDRHEVAACQGEIGEYLCSLPFALRIRDWFFAHTGNTAGRGLYQLAEDLRNAASRDGYAAPELIGKDSLLEADLPTWCENGRAPKAVLDEYAIALGVAHLVQGHEPGAVEFSDGVERRSGEIFQRDGRLFLVDTGMSAAVDKSKGGALRIRFQGGEEAAAICPDGETVVVWNPGWTSTAGRAGRCQ